MGRPSPDVIRNVKVDAAESVREIVEDMVDVPGLPVAARGHEGHVAAVLKPRNEFPRLLFAVAEVIRPQIAN